MNPEKISQFLDHLVSEPEWQIAFCGLYNSLQLLHLRLYNRDARTVELMELQLKYRVEFLLEEERLCLEQSENKLSVTRRYNRLKCLQNNMVFFLVLPIVKRFI